MTQIEGTTVPCGKLDVRPFRDDRPKVEGDETQIPFEVTGKTVILVDEVAFTGRTARAALDGLMRFGRPSTVRLAVLVDRGHRELPIQPDFTGRAIVTEANDRVLVKMHEIDGEDGVFLEKGP